MGAEPHQSFAGRLTRKGRVMNLWARALAEEDEARRLELLRETRERLVAEPERFAELWHPFVEQCLDEQHVGSLTADDMAALEAMAETTSRHGSGAADALLKMVDARTARGEEAAARGALVRCYRTAGTGADVRRRCARELAARGACDADHLRLYADHLAAVDDPLSETVIVALLARVLAVDLDSDATAVERAGVLAAFLREADVAIAGVDRALALTALRAPGGAAEATARFAAALATDPGDRVARTGALAAALEGGDLAGARALVAAAVPPLEPLEKRLRKLACALEWLDGHDLAPPSPPAAAGEIEALGLEPYVPGAVRSALGRLLLVEGDAPAAARALGTVSDSCLSYYAAWAEELSGRERGGEHRGPLEDELEALRTAAARAVRDGDGAEARRTVAQPLFARLPLADRLTWLGHISVLGGDEAQGLAQLERAAFDLGSPRAALALAVHHLERGRLDNGRRCLERAGVDERGELLRAYVDGEPLRALASRDARAAFALGNLSVRRAFEEPARRDWWLEQAAGAFDAGAASPGLARESELAAAAARALAHPDDLQARRALARLWPTVEDIAFVRRQSWAVWTAALATGATAAPDEALAAADAAAELVEGDRRAVVDELRRTLVARLALEGRAGAGARSGAAALVWARDALAKGDRQVAAAALSTVAPDDPEAGLCRTLADLLEGRAPALDGADGAGEVATARSLVTAAAAFASGAPDAGYDALLAAIRGDAAATARVVDIVGVVPALCARAGRRVPPALVAAVRELPLDHADPAAAARCAAAVGDEELAVDRWRRAIARGDPAASEIRQELAGYLCHLAVSARRAGDDRDAIARLRHAASLLEEAPA